ncbi:MAG: copper chaperone [Pseudomonadota bacterium]|nr:copper chaperone [Pseudomonadota bacterium]
MVFFEVPDMYSCRSVGAISKSVKSVDHEATVIIDMVQHRVAIESQRLPRETLKRVIGAAGFTPIEREPDGVDVLLPIGEPETQARRSFQ